MRTECIIIEEDDKILMTITIIDKDKKENILVQRRLGYNELDKIDCIISLDVLFCKDVNQGP